jgi:hypothetical protein
MVTSEFGLITLDGYNAMVHYGVRDAISKLAAG